MLTEVIDGQVRACKDAPTVWGRAAHYPTGRLDIRGRYEYSIRLAAERKGLDLDQLVVEEHDMGDGKTWGAFSIPVA